MTARRLPARWLLWPAGLALGLVLGAGVVGGYLVGGLAAVGAAGVAVAAAVLILHFGAERVLVAVILLNLPLQMDVYLGWRAEEGALGALGGIPLSITTVGVLGLVLHRALAPARARSERLGLDRTWLPLALFLGWSALSLVNAQDWSLARNALLLLVQSFALYLCLSRALRTTADVRWAVDLLLIGLVAEAGIMVLQLTGLQLPALLAADLWRGAPPGGGATIIRASGTLGSPNGAAAYLSVVLMITLAVLLSRPTRLRGALAAAALLGGGAGLGLTLSRGGMVACAVGTVALVALAARRGVLPMAPLLGAAAVAGVLAAVFGDELLLRTTGNPDQLSGRGPLMAIAAQMILSAPILGVGVNNFVPALPEFLTPEYTLTWIYVVHNYYMQIASEVGLPGLLAFVAFLALAMRSALSASKTLPADLAVLALGVLAALLARTVHMNLDVFGAPSQWDSLVVLAALASALRAQAEIRKRALLMAPGAAADATGGEPGPPPAGVRDGLLGRRSRTLVGQRPGAA